LLGYYYIRIVPDSELFEAIVFGFIVVETPNLVLKFILQAELSVKKQPDLEKKEGVIYFDTYPKFYG
jgi:hypothetical protein